MFIKEFSGRVVLVVSCKHVKYKRVRILLKCRRRLHHQTGQWSDGVLIVLTPLFCFPLKDSTCRCTCIDFPLWQDCPVPFLFFVTLLPFSNYEEISLWQVRMSLMPIAALSPDHWLYPRCKKGYLDNKIHIICRIFTISKERMINEMDKMTQNSAKHSPIQNTHRSYRELANHCLYKLISFATSY